MMLARFFVAAAAALVLSAAAPAPSQALHWRLIGPFRGGRTVAVAGVPSQAGVFYMAATDGGIWKSTDYGRTWNPIFDGQDTGSIGALAVAPSSPETLYAGSGEGLRRPDLSVGDGVYKSVDGGKTWKHAGLSDAQQINGIAIDPRNPDRVYVAVMGHPYGPSAQRGLYRTTDGGATWQKVLGDNPDTGASTVVIDPNHPDTLYANLWASRNPPWRLGDSLQLFRDGGIYKSTDGGSTWKKLAGGLPAEMGRAGITVAQSDSNRVYAWVNGENDCGIYSSGDAGATWSKVNGEERICGRGDDFSGIAADTQHAGVVYVANTTTYRSTDGGRHWTGIKGAPGGDDYHSIWIDPQNDREIMLGADQGATISVNGGATWSSWYNQPTAQFYHVIADNRFPYRVFGGQQESGSAEVLSRSDDGEIWSRDWHPVGAEEYAYIAPDPLHPHIIYGAGAGDVTRYDERTEERENVSPAIGGRFSQDTLRYNRTNPLIFNYVDKRTLYLGANVIFATQNGGQSWRVISPDLTRKHPGVPPNIGAFKSTPLAKEERGVVYSIAPSYVNRNVLWAGTDDGLIWVTKDGGAHWTNVTPPGMGAWDKVTQIDGSHFDAQTAYVSVSRFRLNDLRPYVYRTHDFGKHWQLITTGLPSDSPVNTVRDDPDRRGLLFAGNERTVYVSYDDGGRWHSLQNNLPSTSIRDLVVHGNDVVVGTHGRSFWILDDVTPLRQEAAFRAAVAARAPYLFQPAAAYRIRRDEWSDTPLPPEEPAGQNPPDGAIFDYYLPHASTVHVAIYDARGRLVRTYSSNETAPQIDPEITVPTYWVKPAVIPGGSAGVHRFVWDYRYAPPQAFSYDYPISAIEHDTPRVPQGVLALPGTYTVVITADGRTLKRSFRLLLDPRVHVAAPALASQYALASHIVSLMNRSYALGKTQKRYVRLNGQLASLLESVEEADAAPDTVLRSAVEAASRQMPAKR